MSRHSLRRAASPRARSTRLPVAAGALALVAAGTLLAGCAVSDTASEQRIDRERAQASEAARQAEEIKALKAQVDGQKAGSGTQAQAPAPQAAPAPQQPAAAPVQVEQGRVPTSGTYTGVGVQRGLASGTRDKSYGVEMVFSSGGSTIRYPELGCSGRLRPAGFDDGRRVYREQMSAGHCDDGGTWLLTVRSDSRVSATYRPPTGRYVVSADLTR